MDIGMVQKSPLGNIEFSISKDSEDALQASEKQPLQGPTTIFDTAEESQNPYELNAAQTVDPMEIAVSVDPLKGNNINIKI